jgi:hypothetical protein
MAPTDKTALESVIEVDEERHRIEHEVEELSHKSDTGLYTFYKLYFNKAYCGLLSILKLHARI